MKLELGFGDWTKEVAIKEARVNDDGTRLIIEYFDGEQITLNLEDLVEIVDVNEL